ncbi:DUF4344 domain-containing metallopeptidase [Pseudomarimonas salicorniae]|uniref:DUF4344 domain-containing metallopeptidase n=1 Tax=Pseudomarimonas salicorniae TaxID=2933270 RepID=A0ABT0GIQ9_9GAMM|nr:DUF4344 domain-containing metallopeptidase [Lysobacter sp. CAU 1642]MCK7594446.1 DUF4344 domain-containing metallopeptidase [Lysobacter sp. CAU 1642]
MRCSRLLPLLLALSASVAAEVRLATPATSDMADRELAEALQAAGSLERAAGAVNARVQLPQIVTLRYASCADANAWYQPEQGEVRICLSLARHLAALLATQVDDEAQMLEALDGALRFITLHELGHALVDVLQLPVTGREEDAVDQLAAWLLLAEGEGAGVLSAASVFGSELSGSDDLAAVHSLDRQRFFSLLCWVYGSDASRRDSLLADWSLPPERAAGCEEEYAQLGRSWQRLLAAHAPAAPESAPPAPGVGPDAGSESHASGSKSPDQNAGPAADGPVP